MRAAHAPMRRAPGLGSAAAPRAASRAMSLRSDRGPAVVAAGLLLLLHLGVLVSRVMLFVVLSAPVFLPWATEEFKLPLGHGSGGAHKNQSFTK